MQRYLAKRPKLEASKALEKIVYRLTQTTEKNFTKKLDKWHEEYQSFFR